jgi:peptidoglycan/xylan/chitin deacetylase (PgdA/CDA1 family)
MYHGVGEPPDDVEEAEYVVPAAMFEAQMRLLMDEARPVLGLEALAGGRYPDRAVVLTFDDGNASDARVVAPILRELSFPAAFFVNPERVGHPGRASWDELRAMAEAGFRIGSHGFDHTPLDELSESELRHQVVDAKQWLESELARPVDAMSLPGGTGGDRAVRIAREAGHAFVLGSRPAALRGAAGSEALPRLALRRHGGLPRFRAAIDLHTGPLVRQALRYHAARTARVSLGSGLYFRLRRLWFPESDTPGGV